MHRDSLGSNFSNCHVLFGCLHSLYTRRCSRLNYRTASMRCFVSHTWTLRLVVRVINRLPHNNQPCWCQLNRNCDQPTSTATSVVDDTAYLSGGAPSRTRTTVADGHKFSAVRHLSRRLVEKRNFSFPHLHLAPPFWVISSEFRRDLLRQKRFDTISVCDRQTDRLTGGRTNRWTRDDSKYRASIASRGYWSAALV